MSLVDFGGGKRGPGDRDDYEMPEAKAVAAEGAAKLAIQHQFAAACNAGNYAEADRALRIYGGAFLADVFQPWYTGGVRVTNLAADEGRLRVLLVLVQHGLLLSPADAAAVRERMRQADHSMVFHNADRQTLARFRNARHEVLRTLEGL